jgi:hypothetical protein
MFKPTASPTRRESGMTRAELVNAATDQRVDQLRNIQRVAAMQTAPYIYKFSD